MSTEFAVMILAGGLGKRLWPLSSEEHPKQFLPLFGGRSMLQATFDRAVGLVGADRVFLIGNKRHEQLYREQLPDLPAENLVLEPIGKGTAAAVALAARVVSQRPEIRAAATIPADHVIPDAKPWSATLESALECAATTERIVCIGTEARRGETKFGYMLLGGVLNEGDRSVRSVERFAEKPSADELDSMIDGGNCVRNMGMVAFHPGVMTREMDAFVPAVIEALGGVDWRDEQELAAAYANLPDVSVDEAVLQRSDRVACAVGQIANLDAGDFVTLGDAVGRDANGNASVGRIVAVDSERNTVFARESTVALVGVEGLVVVVEGDQILVCPATETQRIKKLSEKH